MKRTINVTIRNKVAAASNDVIYICGNSDFIINFDFDDEWNEHKTKTARFIHGGGYTDVIFDGNQCAVPIISNTHNILVGVYAGNLRTTTPAIIYAKKSILCGDGTPAAPPDDVYNQIMEQLNKLSDDMGVALEEYLKENPLKESDPTVPAWAKAEEKPKYTAYEVGAIAEDELENAVNLALTKAKESGEFDGPAGPNGQPGKDGYTPVKGVDYFDGKDGLPGADGQPGKDGQDGYTPIKGIDYFDGADGQPGKDGAGGKDGQDGYTPQKGIDYFDGKDGKDGVDGNPGADGVSCTHSWNGTVLSVTSASGTSSVDLKGEPGADGKTPVKGTDYYTAADKTEMVNLVLAALPTWTGGSY